MLLQMFLEKTPESDLQVDSLNCALVEMLKQIRLQMSQRVRMRGKEMFMFRFPKKVIRCLNKC